MFKLVLQFKFTTNLLQIKSFFQRADHNFDEVFLLFVLYFTFIKNNCIYLWVQWMFWIGTHWEMIKSCLLIHL